MPAEWSPHAATWISWPHNPETWPGLLAEAEAAMTDFVVALAPYETVHINVLNDEHAEAVARRFERSVPEGSVVLHRVPTDDAWIRDYGAIIVRDANGDYAAVDFGYNAWGGKYPPYDHDLAVAARMAEILALPRVACDMILEGGSVDVNGAGLGLVTEQCLLNPNRNPTLGRQDIVGKLRDLLGLTELIWLGDGVVGDDTDGHIDNLCRFVAERAVVTVVASDRDDPNYAPLADNLARLEAFESADGRGLEIQTLPLPAPVFHRGQRLPASYANFLIANEIVLMPSYGCAEDDAARGVLADCFADRRIVPIDCRALVAGLGALHCLTQQIPVMVAAAA